MTQPDAAAAKPLGDKIFSAQDQRDFAAASHDWNPMHVDAVAARRLLAGRQVVHGIHTLIHALDLWAPQTPIGRSKVSCRFANTVSVGDRVVFSHTEDTAGRVTLLAAVDGLTCTEIVIEPAVAAASQPGVDHTLPARCIADLSAPLDEAPGSQAGTLIELLAWHDQLAARFPRAAALLGADGLSALARLSFFVGMVCPGLHSVFSSVEFRLGDAAESSLRFEVRKYDPRLKFFIVVFDGALHGELRAFLRPPPQPQPGAREVAGHLQGDEFRGTRSLVIGGSRGLGETTAKIVAAGGGDVVVSYAVGREDALAVAADINAGGRGRCDAVQLDLQTTFAGTPDIDPAKLDAVYFFATPRIYSKRNEVFDRAAFDAFVDFYLVRFHELCRWLDRTERARPLQVYLPSTVFINERPKGMTEYTMAKAAAEVLADDLNRNLRHVKVVHSRLPRLATDQTASILKVSVGSNLDAMLAVVRQMSSAMSSL